MYTKLKMRENSTHHINQIAHAIGANPIANISNQVKWCLADTNNNNNNNMYPRLIAFYDAAYLAIFIQFFVDIP